MKELVGVILAAGRGRRMGSLGEAYVKALLPVANEPIIAHHLRLFASLGISKVLIVVGHHADQVEEALGRGQRYGLNLQFIRQVQPLGSAHALASVRSLVRGPFLLVLGDYYFVSANAAAMLRRLAGGESAIAVKRELHASLVREACLVETTAEGRVVRIVEKPSTPHTQIKGCGFYALLPEVFDAVARTPRTALRDEYELTVSLELFVRTGNPLYAEEIIGWDSNITRPDDLLQCNLEWLRRHNLNELVGAESSVDPLTQLERTIVGQRAVVRGNRRLSEVVVFPGANSSDLGILEQTLLTPEGPVFCSAESSHP